MTQPLPTLGPVVPDNEAVAAAIGVQLGDLAGGHLPVRVASSGVPFLYVPLSSRAAVGGASAERARLCALLHALNLEELPVFVFSPDSADDDATVYSRMFAPCDPGRQSMATPQRRILFS
jgi:trans-2,3-dihydro-3-hydroxyanthranilate isomerase